MPFKIVSHLNTRKDPGRRAVTKGFSKMLRNNRLTIGPKKIVDGKRGTLVSDQFLQQHFERIKQFFDAGIIDVTSLPRTGRHAVEVFLRVKPQGTVVDVTEESAPAALASRCPAPTPAVETPTESEEVLGDGPSEEALLPSNIEPEPAKSEPEPEPKPEPKPIKNKKPKAPKNKKPKAPKTKVD